MSKELYFFEKNVRTVWQNAENPTGEPGRAAMTGNGRKGSPCVKVLHAGQTLTLAQAEGKGCVRRIWLTIGQFSQPCFLKGAVLECFWDGSVDPAVSVPFGDFFCFNSAAVTPMENCFFSSPEGRSFNCTIPMPFKNGMRITLTNGNSFDLTMVFYEVDYTLGDDVDNALYFHAYYNRTVDSKMMEDHEILPHINGYGRYLGASFGVIANPALGNTWWGEGEVKCFIDGDGGHPTLAGTGTEDYIGTGWGQSRYICDKMGCTFADEKAKRYSFYRFHVDDPVWFGREIRVTIQQIGYQLMTERELLLNIGRDIILSPDGDLLKPESPVGQFERFGDDWCSVAYFYLDTPSSSLKTEGKEVLFRYATDKESDFGAPVGIWKDE